MGTSSAGGQTVDVVGGGARQMEMAERVGRGEERERGGNAGKMNGLLNGMKSPLLADPEPPFLNDVGFYEQRSSRS